MLKNITIAAITTIIATSSMADIMFKLKSGNNFVVQTRSNNHEIFKIHGQSKKIYINGVELKQGGGKVGEGDIGSKELANGSVIFKKIADSAIANSVDFGSETALTTASAVKQYVTDEGNKIKRVAKEYTDEETTNLRRNLREYTDEESEKVKRIAREFTNDEIDKLRRALREFTIEEIDNLREEFENKEPPKPPVGKVPVNTWTIAELIARCKIAGDTNNGDIPYNADKACYVDYDGSHRATIKLPNAGKENTYFAIYHRSTYGTNISKTNTSFNKVYKMNIDIDFIYFKRKNNKWVAQNAPAQSN